MKLSKVAAGQDTAIYISSGKLANWSKVWLVKSRSDSGNVRLVSGQDSIYVYEFEAENMDVEIASYE